MLKIGQYNTLKVTRTSEHGAYLSDDEGNEVLMPQRYVTETIKPGEEIKVFVYTDSEDRPVATTDHPYATVNTFAFLQVVEVNKTGAFLDWGLPKDLLVPYREQKTRLRPGGIYPVYVYLDANSHRVVASAKIERFIGNVFPDLNPGDRVKCLVYQHTEIGYKVIVNNLYAGMIYDNELYQPIEVEQEVEAYVKRVRDDGKLDLTLAGSAAHRVNALAERILASIGHNGGTLPVTDRSAPERIEALYGCSKKDFKRAVGQLYKAKQIAIDHETGAITRV